MPVHKKAQPSIDGRASYRINKLIARDQKT